MSVLVKDFMKAPVSTCVLQSDVGKVRDLMRQKGFSAVPIVEIKGEQILIRGIVTNTDLMGAFDDTVPIEQVMTHGVYVIDPESTAQEAAKMMLNHKIHHLLVIEETRIIGMLSSLDFVRLIASQGFGD
ncbi:MAG: CBS domain-containing protein [Saprospiraceae bacterium]|nr:CBS domain-containing protein [Saprospiraceae bacterium]